MDHVSFIFTAIYQKAEALYHLGDFEHSLVFYHRGLHVRPELEQFRLGVQKAREAIENAIGKFKSFHPIMKFSMFANHLLNLMQWFF